MSVGVLLDGRCGAAGSTLYRLLVGRKRLYGNSLRWRISERVVNATRVSLALAGAKGSLRVSMCQIASEIRRATSTWANLCAALFTQAELVAFVAVAKDVAMTVVDGGFDEGRRR